MGDGCTHAYRDCIHNTEITKYCPECGYQNTKKQRISLSYKHLSQQSWLMQFYYCNDCKIMFVVNETDKE